MADQWIPASIALQIIDPMPLGESGHFTLCERANAGLIRTRARLLMINSERRENFVLPPDFWWARGHAALEQTWSSGDFSTWINQSMHWKAFGVDFDLSGVLEILPIEQRARTAQKLSVVGMDGWVTAKAARQFAFGPAGISPSFAGRALIDACLLGYVAARAVLMRRTEGERLDQSTFDEREWDIPEWFWENFTSTDSSAQDWERGVFSGKGKGPNGYCSIMLNGVYFLASTLDVLLPRESKSAEVATPAKRGRRPEYDWGAAMSAIWGKLHRGELIPAVQAEIEAALISHLKKGEKEPSESTVRPYASRIWEEFRKP